jgi:hypothetical protein
MEYDGAARQLFTDFKKCQDSISMEVLIEHSYWIRSTNELVKLIKTCLNETTVTSVSLNTHVMHMIHSGLKRARIRFYNHYFSTLL